MLGLSKLASLFISLESADCASRVKGEVVVNRQLEVVRKQTITGAGTNIMRSNFLEPPLKRGYSSNQERNKKISFQALMRRKFSELIIS